MLESGELTLDKGMEYSEKKQALLAVEKEVQEIAGVLADLREQRKTVLQSRMSAKEKRDLINEITAMELMAVESIPELRQEAFR